MSTTFAARLTGPDGRNLRLYLTIDGIADVLQEADADVPSTFVATTDRPRRRLIQTIEHGQSELDLDRRRMVGGSLRVVLIDDFSNTLANLFASRVRRQTYVTATTTATTTTISVSSTTGMAASGTVYIGGETITYTGTTATTLTGCTRGSFGSTAQRHYGGTDQGASVYTTPPRWVGRRVRLFGYFINDDGTTTTSLREQLDTFRIESAPKFLGQGRWELRCSHLSDEVAQRKLGTGLRKINALQQPATDDPSSAYIVWGTEGQTGLFPSTTSGRYPSYIAVTFADVDGTAVLRFREAADVSTTRVDVKTDAEGDLGNFDRRTNGLIPETLQHWTILHGADAGTLALFALTSILGDAANGSYDLLAGTNRDTGVGGEEFRFGAGIPSAEIDSANFVSVGFGAISGWSYIIDRPIDVAEFLADFCLVTDSIWLVRADGKLTTRRLSETRTAGTLTIDDSTVIGEPTLEVAEDLIYPRARIKCGYDPAVGDFVDALSVIDVEMANRYPERGDTLELETRAFCLSRTTLDRGVVSPAQIETLIRRRMVDDGRGRLYLQVTCTLAALGLSLGDVVNINLNLPDFEKGTLVNRKGRIVSRQPNYDAGTVSLRIQVLETLFHIAPACVIASAVGSTLTLRTTGAEIPDANPARMFPVGDNVQVIDVSAGVIELHQVQSVTAPATVVLATTPSFAIQANNDYIRSADNLGSGNTSANGYQDKDFLFQMPSAGTRVTRWR